MILIPDLIRVKPLYLYEALEVKPLYLYEALPR
jgi:hypothetical protein